MARAHPGLPCPTCAGLRRDLAAVHRQIAEAAPWRPKRRRLPDTRDSKTTTIRLTHAVDGGAVETIDCYVIVGLYDDGAPGELFIHVDRQGSTISGFADAVALAVSLGLQYGVPIEVYVRKMRGMRFEPSGRTADSDHPFASSLLDAVAVWLARTFLPPTPEATP